MAIDLPGKRRGASALNLVPYIDLLTCLIAFLLISAVWVQVVGLRSHARGGGETATAPPFTVTVHVAESGFRLAAGSDTRVLPRAERAHDLAALGAAMAELKAAHPDQEDVIITAEDPIPVDTLVRTMDTVLAAGFPAVTVSPL